jgi:glucose/arabinose dehydrogenase
VPVYDELAANLPDFAPPLKTFFTVPTGYDKTRLGNATVAPSGIDLYTSSAIPGWRNSLLMTAMMSGVVFRMPVTDAGQLGAPLTYFKARDRYRDLAIAPDGRRIFAVTDNEGRTSSDTGVLTTELEHRGALLEFTYAGPRGGPKQ